MNNRLTRFLANRTRRWADKLVQRRSCDICIPTADGRPYLRRWYVIPRNPIFNIYLHIFVESDDDRAFHDHPWWSLSLMLSQDGAIEYYHRLSWLDNKFVSRKDVYFGDLVFRRAKHEHRIVLHETMESRRPATTLFITGPRFRTWGFWCDPKADRFVDWKQFHKKGCD